MTTFWGSALIEEKEIKRGRDGKWKRETKTAEIETEKGDMNREQERRHSFLHAVKITRVGGEE